MITDRQKTILEALIREYVETAEPVASEELVRKRQIPFSPATVRSEFSALSKAGYVSQPHTSAGRVPTDKGYRFFINHLTGENRVENREVLAIRDLARLDDPAEFMKQASRLLAHLTRNFVMAGFPDEDVFYKSGISEVMREPEFSDTALMHEFSALIDEIEEEVAHFFDPAEFAEPRTFIGAENPIRGARRYGMIISSYDTPFHKESLIALVGPKRMDYKHNLALLKQFREILAS